MGAETKRDKLDVENDIFRKERELRNIEKSLTVGGDISADELKSFFGEVYDSFGDKVKKTIEDAERFNLALKKDRVEWLSKQKEIAEKELLDLQTELGTFDN